MPATSTLLSVPWLESSLARRASGVELYRDDVDGEAWENPHAASVSGICMRCEVVDKGALSRGRSHG